MTVLVVEDHRDVADTLQMGLEEYGYRVDIARNGLDGEVMARTKGYDLMILDWMMPGQDGPQVLRKLRNEGVTTPVLMLTARVEQIDQMLSESAVSSH